MILPVRQIWTTTSAVLLVGKAQERHTSRSRRFGLNHNNNIVRPIHFVHAAVPNDNNNNNNDDNMDNNNLMLVEDFLEQGELVTDTSRTSNNSSNTNNNNNSNNNDASLLVEPPVMFYDENNNFDFQRWDSHRSSDRYRRLLGGLFFGVTTKRILPPILVLTLWSATIDYYNSIEQLYGLPEVELPLTPFELTAPVLGLLLVFRSNTAYERFDLGSCTTWDITANTISIIRSLLSWTAAPHVSEQERLAAAELAEACVLLHAWIMTDYLRTGQSMDETTYDLFFTKTVGQLSSSSSSSSDDSSDNENIDGGETTIGEANGQPPPSVKNHHRSSFSPNIGVTALSLGIATRLPSLDTQETTRLDEQLSNLVSSLSTCEKLLRTPIPLGYTRYSVRFLWAWLVLLPFALVHTFQTFGSDTWWEDKPQPVLVLAMLFISFTYLSIEDISVQIEEPFCILPLELHQQWLSRDVNQMTKLTSRMVNQQQQQQQQQQQSSSQNVRQPPSSRRQRNFRNMR
mmetsp:Transcript_32748/g.49356  ORF Transcript_32748/g.49356 Transcript_32748/m.49356 type:complete len:514 (+) Transcript_32748:225-1766(+)